MLQGPICSGFGFLHAMEKNLFIISGVVRGICCSSDELPSLSAPKGLGYVQKTFCGSDKS